MSQTIATVYITAGLPAQDSAGTLPSVTTHTIATAYITAGLAANDYVAAGGGNVMLLLLNNTLGGDANRMTSME